MWMPLGWVSASGGGTTASFELISTTVLASATPSVTFNLTAGQQTAYKHLQLRVVGLASTAGGSAFIQFNGDTAANYAYHFLWGSGSGTPASGNLASESSGALMFGIQGLDNVYHFGAVTDILDVQSTTKNKTTRTLSGRVQSGATEVDMCSGLWMSTAAVTSLTIKTSNNFAATSRFSLYGIRG